MSLLKAYNKAVKDLDVGTVDQACVELGRALCRAVEDGDGDIDRVSSQLTRVLVELRMTPKSRDKVTVTNEPKSNPIDELKRKRAARASNA